MIKEQVMIKKAALKSEFKAEDLKALEVLEEIKSGKVNAFNYLYDKYNTYIQHYCYQRIKDRQIAQDLTVEILTKIYRSLDKYTVEYTFNAWVWRLAKNYVVDYVRANKNNPVNSNRNLTIEFQEPKTDDSGSYVTATQVVSKDLTPEEMMTAKKRKEYVDKILSMMDERDRRILTMYYFEDKSYEEIANEMGLNLNSMKVYLMRAKEKMKNKIGSYNNVLDLMTA